MSKSFNINLFKSSVNAFCAEKSARPIAFATFLADNLSSALESTLIDGSDSINQAFLILKNSGKAGLSVKFRKVCNDTDWSPLSFWGQVSELAFIKASGYIGGNSQKCTDKDQRRDAVELIRENIKAKGIDIFTPAAKDVDADPLAMFGKFNSEKIDEVLARADIDQLAACMERVQSLGQRVSTALETAKIAAMQAIRDAAEKTGMTVEEKIAQLRAIGEATEIEATNDIPKVSRKGRAKTKAAPDASPILNAA